MVRFGIVGFGRIGKRHAMAIEDCSDAGLVAICDPADIEVPKGTTRYDSIDAMLREAAPEIVCVCSPNGYHTRQSLQLLEGGVHVICEKPMALTTDAADAMIDTARKHDRHLFCMLQNRYSPQAGWLKEVISRGRLGETLQVQVNCFWNRDKRYYQHADGSRHNWHGSVEMDGGPLPTQFSHFVDLLVWLFGAFRVGKATFRNFTHGDAIEFEDAGMFDFEVGENGFGCFHYSTAVWDKNQESSITIIGSKGSIRLGGQYMDRLEYCHYEGLTGLPDFSDGTVTGKAGNHELVIANAVDVALGRAQPDFDIMDAREGIRIIEEVYSHRQL